jgi:hypothetical protein
MLVSNVMKAVPRAHQVSDVAGPKRADGSQVQKEELETCMKDSNSASAVVSSEMKCAGMPATNSTAT